MTFWKVCSAFHSFNTHHNSSLPGRRASHTFSQSVSLIIRFRGTPRRDEADLIPLSIIRGSVGYSSSERKNSRLILEPRSRSIFGV